MRKWPGGIDKVRVRFVRLSVGTGGVFLEKQQIRPRCRLYWWVGWAQRTM